LRVHGRNQFDLGITAMMKTPDPNARPPFWQHRYYYLALKMIVLACAAYVALSLAGHM